MLSQAEREAIDSQARHAAYPRAAVGDALLVVQKSRGWVSDEGVRDVAQALGLTAEEVDGVATFFELVFRKPVGKHVILLCDSVSCWILGEERILDHARKSLGVAPGDTTSDGQFTLLPVGCLGACDQGPAMMIDGELFVELTPERFDAIVQRYRAPSGTPGATGAGGAA